jgi:hypothetical protein
VVSADQDTCTVRACKLRFPKQVRRKFDEMTARSAPLDVSAGELVMISQSKHLGYRMSWLLVVGAISKNVSALPAVCRLIRTCRDIWTYDESTLVRTVLHPRHRKLPVRRICYDVAVKNYQIQVGLCKNYN